MYARAHTDTHTLTHTLTHTDTDTHTHTHTHTCACFRSAFCYKAQTCCLPHHLLWLKLRLACVGCCWSCCCTYMLRCCLLPFLMRLGSFLRSSFAPSSPPPSLCELKCVQYHIIYHIIYCQYVLGLLKLRPACVGCCWSCCCVFMLRCCLLPFVMRLLLN